MFGKNKPDIAVAGRKICKKIVQRGIDVRPVRKAFPRCTIFFRSHAMPRRQRWFLYVQGAKQQSFFIMFFIVHFSFDRKLPAFEPMVNFTPALGG
jgi:hypothetical protein